MGFGRPLGVVLGMAGIVAYLPVYVCTIPYFSLVTGAPFQGWPGSVITRNEKLLHQIYSSWSRQGRNPPTRIN